MALNDFFTDYISRKDWKVLGEHYYKDRYFLEQIKQTNNQYWETHKFGFDLAKLDRRSRDSAILDIGAGHGIMAHVLQQYGFTDVECTQILDGSMTGNESTAWDHLNVQPYHLKIERQQRFELPRKYDIIFSFGNPCFADMDGPDKSSADNLDGVQINDNKMRKLLSLANIQKKKFNPTTKASKGNSEEVGAGKFKQGMNELNAMQPSESKDNTSKNTNTAVDKLLAEAFPHANQDDIESMATIKDVESFRKFAHIQGWNKTNDFQVIGSDGNMHTCTTPYDIADWELFITNIKEYLTEGGIAIINPTPFPWNKIFDLKPTWEYLRSYYEEGPQYPPESGPFKGFLRIEKQ